MSKNVLEQTPGAPDPLEPVILAELETGALVDELNRRFTQAVVITCEHDLVADTTLLNTYFHGGRYACIGMAEAFKQILISGEDYL